MAWDPVDLGSWFLAEAQICLQCTVFQENVPSVIFLWFLIFWDKAPLNKKSERWPDCIFGRSLIWDHLQRIAKHLFPGKGALCVFKVLSDLVGGFRSFDGILRVKFITNVVQLTYKPVFYGYSSTLQIVLCWMLANFTDNKKTARGSAAAFGTPVYTFVSHMLLNF